MWIQVLCKPLSLPAILFFMLVTTSLILWPAETRNKEGTGQNTGHKGHAISCFPDLAHNILCFLICLRDKNGKQQRESQWYEI